MEDQLEQPKKKARRSRHATSAPIIRNGKEVTASELAPREERDLIPILHLKSGRKPWPYFMLPRDNIMALLPEWAKDEEGNKHAKGGAEYARKRFPKLAHDGHLHYPEMQTNTRFCRTSIYSHPDTPLDEKEFWHDLAPNMIGVHIEIGVRDDPALILVNQQEIFDAPSMPDWSPRSATIEIPRPDIKLKDGKTKKAKPWRVTPDWQIFGVGKSDESAFRFYHGFEYDRGTEPLRRNTNPSKSITSMLKRMIEIDQLRLASKLYGLPDLYFVIICHKRHRMLAMMDLLAEETGGLGHPRILFNTFSAYNTYEKPLPPDGSWFRSTFKRVAGKGATWNEDYYMNQL